MENHSPEPLFAELLIRVRFLDFGDFLQGLQIHPRIWLFSPAVHYFFHVIFAEDKRMTIARTSIASG